MEKYISESVKGDKKGDKMSKIIDYILLSLKINV